MGSGQGPWIQGASGEGPDTPTLPLALGPQVPTPEAKRPRPALGAGLGTVPLLPARPGLVGGPQVAEVGASPEHVRPLSDMQRQQQLGELSTPRQLLSAGQGAEWRGTSVRSPLAAG